MYRWKHSLLEAVREQIRRGDRACFVRTDVAGAGEWAGCVALIHIVDRVACASRIVAGVAGRAARGGHKGHGSPAVICQNFELRIGIDKVSRLGQPLAGGIVGDIVAERNNQHIFDAGGAIWLPWRTDDAVL